MVANPTSLSQLDGTSTLKGSYDDELASFRMHNINSLIPVEYDELELAYTVNDLTSVIYKLGGATVATLTLSYTTGKLTGVVKS